MPPGYQRLQIPQSISGPPSGAFDQKAVSWDEEQAKQAALLAQQLNNQSTGISVKQRQQAYDDDQAERETLKAQFGGGEEMPDEDQVMSVIQRLAMQRGDADTVLGIEKIKNSRLAAQASQRRADIYENQVNNPLLNERRELQNDLMEQRRDGTQVRPLVSSQEDELTSLSEVGGLTTDILDRYMPHISENRAVRWAEAKANPNSAIARMDNELVQLVFALAAARNGKRISDADYRFMAPLVKPNALDTIATVEDKIRRVVEFAELRKGELLDVLKKSGRNVSKFTGGNEPNPDDLANSLAGSSQMDEETAYKEAHKAKLRAQRGK